MVGNAHTTLFNVTYFTDPLCCWSWGMQRHLDSIQEHFKDRMTIKYVMGGMIPSWSNYVDPSGSISRPAQMGPVWMHAAQLTNRPINYQLWMKDPPASSYPACIAVKCAALQSDEAAIGLFKRLQQAAMRDLQNIARGATIRLVARCYSRELPSFSEQQFTSDWQAERGTKSFHDDLASTAQQGVARFPTLLVAAAGERGTLIPGYRTHEGLLHAIKQAFPAYSREPGKSYW